MALYNSVLMHICYIQVRSARSNSNPYMNACVCEVRGGGYQTHVYSGARDIISGGVLMHICYIQVRSARSNSNPYMNACVCEVRGGGYQTHVYSGARDIISGGACVVSRP